MQKILRVIGTVRDYVGRARKALVPAVAALGLIVGTDAPLYADVVAVLVALGVWTVPNKQA